MIIGACCVLSDAMESAHISLRNSPSPTDLSVRKRKSAPASSAASAAPCDAPAAAAAAAKHSKRSRLSPASNNNLASAASDACGAPILATGANFYRTESSLFKPVVSGYPSACEGKVSRPSANNCDAGNSPMIANPANTASMLAAMALVTRARSSFMIGDILNSSRSWDAAAHLNPYAAHLNHPAAAASSHDHHTPTMMDAAPRINHERQDHLKSEEDDSDGEDVDVESNNSFSSQASCKFN